jgi:hypothetical protein
MPPLPFAISSAIIIGLNPDVEEEVLVRVGSLELVVFADVCPYQIGAGERHQVELSLTVLDEADVRTDVDDPDRAQRIHGFRYLLTGAIHGEVLAVRDVYFDASDIADPAIASGTRITTAVDRISATFVRREAG